MPRSHSGVIGIVCRIAAVAGILAMPALSQAAVVFTIGSTGNDGPAADNVVNATNGSAWTGVTLNSPAGSGYELLIDSDNSLLAATFSIDGSLAGTTFTLVNVGDSQTVAFGSIVIDDHNINSNETDTLGINATTFLSTVPPGGPASGQSISLTGTASQGAVPSPGGVVYTFSPLFVTFAGTGQYKVELTDVVTGDSRANTQTHTFSETFTLVDAPIVIQAVSPEPASMAMWAGLGLAGCVASWRRKRAAAC